ncbi:hypothetical protein M5E87_03960 [Flavonifractor plautii]|nr:hypothetical protein M5E87_03960 [Flavonifractor plautii]
MKRSISIPTDTLWQAGFLLLAPLTAAWLMQFTYGVLPWAMPFPALLANALCIALLYWPLCGLTGRIAPCCIGIHIAAGAWGAANCFVQSFRGTPILPWDLSALGTAADVAGSYRFTPTWQMLAAVALAAALVVFLHPEKHKARLRLTGTRRPLRLVCLGAGLACLLLLFPTGRLERFGVKTDVWDPALLPCWRLPGGIPPQHGVPRGGGAGGRRAGAAGTDHGRRGAAGGGGFRGAAQYCGHHERVLGRL